MKKLSYIVLGGMLVFAACQSNNTQDSAALQHKIDSTAQELIKPEIEKLEKACDERIMTAAMDSAKVILEKSKKGTVKHTVKPVTKKTEVPKVNVPSGRSLNGSGGTATGRQTTNASSASSTSTVAQPQGTATGRKMNK